MKPMRLKKLLIATLVGCAVLASPFPCSWNFAPGSCESTDDCSPTEYGASSFVCYNPAAGGCCMCESTPALCDSQPVTIRYKRYFSGLYCSGGTCEG